MKKLIAGLVVGLVVVAVGVVAWQNKSAVKMEQAGSPTGGEVKIGSRYVPYSRAVFEGAVSGRRVLYFYANWCPICRPADQNLRENESKISRDVTVIRVNYNDPDTDQEEKDLAKKYGVVYQHTFVQIDGEGKEVASWSGGQIEELLANIE